MMDWGWLFGDSEPVPALVRLEMQLRRREDAEQVITLLEQSLRKVPELSNDPPPEVCIRRRSVVGPVITVSARCSQDNYWQAYEQTRRAAKDVQRTLEANVDSKN